MHAWRWWAVVLAGTLAGCIVDRDIDNEPGWDDPAGEWPDPAPSANAADLRVDSLTGPAGLGAGSQQVQARLCNIGTGSALADAAFYLSSDRYLDGADVLLGTSPRVALWGGDCKDVTAWVSAQSLREGSYYLLAAVDPDGLVPEASESNNERAGSSVLVDRTAPPTPSPSWTGGSQSQSLSLQTEPGATVRVYSGAGCTGSVVTTTEVGPGAYCELPIPVPSGTGSTYSVRVYDSVGNGSNCSPAMEYPYGGGTGGGTGALAPVLLGTRPGSPGLSLEPIFDGRARAGATVEVFQRADCQGTVDAVLGTDSIGNFTFKGSVAKNGKLTLSARERGTDGYTQAPCSNSLEYQNDSTAPLPPDIIDVKWQYTSTGREVRVVGTAEPGATVGIFVDAACTGMPVRTVRADAEGRFTATAPFSAGGSHRVFVAAKDAVGNISACAEGPAYELRCPAGRADCDGNSSNGCEVDLTANANHCGACGHVCQDPPYADGVCVAATCGNVCAAGYYDCDGNTANGCESRTACGPTACTIHKPSELMMTALSVVEDPVRTAPGGAWHFGTLMRELAGGQDPSPLVRGWLKTWLTKQMVNGLELPARPEMQTKVLGPWETRSGGPSAPLDFNTAPFRLLAIVNRMDLRRPGVQAGEGRFVFGVVDTNGAPLELIVILEYALPGSTAEAIQQWAQGWHELGTVKVGGQGYNAKLQALTDRFTKAGVMTGRTAGSALNQLRTNEIALAEPWEMREFNLSPLGLLPTTVKLTPAAHFENTEMLASYIQESSADIIAERHTVPDSRGGIPFLGASARVPLDFFWRAPGVLPEARHKFSLNTCSGCHAGETQTNFTHVSPRAKGTASVLSPFLKGTTVTDPVTKSVRTFDDLGRRAEDLKALVCPSSTSLKSGLPAESNLPPARVH